MRQPRYPSTEVMTESTERVTPIETAGAARDPVEFDLFLARIYDSSPYRVSVRELLNMPVLIPEMVIGRMS
jgi:hypothetical protein